MRSEDEVAEYRQQAQVAIIYGCSICHGTDSDCRCYKRYGVAIAAHEACVPRDFWAIKDQDVTHNVEVFRKIVKKYTKRLDQALKRGYGLVFLGDNGVGKTYFLSYVLMKAIRAGRTSYYTTMPQLDHDIKRGFNDPAAERRLAWMLTSDFLAIDELGKERHKARQLTYIDTQIERILKQRCDDGLPVLLATNMDHEALMSAYGPTVGSLIGGKYQIVMMKPGDYRAKMTQQMDDDMGYKQ